MKRPADEEILSLIGDKTLTAKEIYGYFGCKTANERGKVKLALDSLVRYHILDRMTVLVGKHICFAYWRI